METKSIVRGVRLSADKGRLAGFLARNPQPGAEQISDDGDEGGIGDGHAEQFGTSGGFFLPPQGNFARV